MSLLAAREAYRLWAPGYEAENAVSFLEDRLAQELSPDPATRTLLDAGCGTGRRLAPLQGRAFGVDLVPEMLAAGGLRGRVAAADLRALPFRNGSFDLVWCRLVLGHLQDPAPAYAELARVCRVGGGLLVSDFHPAAAEAGHRRTFRDPSGELHEVEHFVHPPELHAILAARHGLMPTDRREGVVGPLLRPFYAARGLEERYREQLGLPLVLALLFARTDAG